MGISQRHIEKLLETYSKYKNISPLPGGFFYLNPKCRGVLLKNIKEISFSNFYPRILISIFESGILPFELVSSEKSNIEKIKYFLDNKADIRIKSDEEYEKYKKFTNSYFGRLAQYYQPGPESGRIACVLLLDYQNMIYQEILAMNPEKIVYIDTDHFFYIDEINMPDIELPYVTDDIDIIFIESEKKYIKHNGITSLEGLFKKERKDELLKIIRSELREMKFEKLGIN